MDPFVLFFVLFVYLDQGNLILFPNSILFKIFFYIPLTKFWVFYRLAYSQKLVPCPASSLAMYVYVIFTTLLYILF